MPCPHISAYTVNTIFWFLDHKPKSEDLASITSPGADRDPCH